MAFLNKPLSSNSNKCENALLFALRNELIIFVDIELSKYSAARSLSANPFSLNIPPALI